MEKRIKSYGQFLDHLKEADGFGTEPFLFRRDGDMFYYFFQLDMEEGADMLMVKPALAYLDIIHLMKENFPIPITAYNVSGECAMVIAAAEKGWLNYEDTFTEVLTSIKRAGADIILTYFAKDFANLKK